MRIPKGLAFILLAVTITGLGCARAARNTEGFATTDSLTVNKPMPEVWQTTKEVLREQGFNNEPNGGSIYTRDKRGVFVAFSRMKRNFFLMPHRTKYTIALESVTDSSTKITVEAVRQVYGVTLLTYPDWHDRKNTDHSVAQNLLNAVQTRSSTGPSA